MLQSMSSDVPEVREVGCIGVKDKILPGRDSFEGFNSLYKDFDFDMRTGSTVLDNLGHSLADIKYTLLQKTLPKDSINAATIETNSSLSH
jgi:hypothetical protein